MPRYSPEELHHVPRRGTLPDAAAQGTEQGQGGEVGAGQGAGADTEVDRDPALLGPVDVLKVQEQRELIDDEGQPGAVGQGHGRVPTAGVLAVDGDGADAADHADAPHVVVQVRAADAQVTERALAVLDAVGDAPDGAERGSEGEPAEQCGPLPWVQFLVEHGADVFAGRGCNGHWGTIPFRFQPLRTGWDPVAWAIRLSYAPGAAMCEPIRWPVRLP